MDEARLDRRAEVRERRIRRDHVERLNHRRADRARRIRCDRRRESPSAARARSPSPFRPGARAAPRRHCASATAPRACVIGAEELAIGIVGAVRRRRSACRIAIAVSASIAFGGMLSEIAAAYTIGLNDEPGCRFPSIARLNCDAFVVAAANERAHVARRRIDRDNQSLQVFGSLPFAGCRRMPVARAAPRHRATSFGRARSTAARCIAGSSVV